MSVEIFPSYDLGDLRFKQLIHQHVPKTGGTYVNHFLHPIKFKHYWPPAGTRIEGPAVVADPYAATEADRIVFSVARNPFDWLVSFYHHFNFPESVLDSTGQRGSGAYGRIEKILWGYHCPSRDPYPTFAQCVDEIIRLDAHIPSHPLLIPVPGPGRSQQWTGYLHSIIRHSRLSMMYQRGSGPVAHFVILNEHMAEAVDMIREAIGWLPHDPSLAPFPEKQLLHNSKNRVNFGTVRSGKDYREFYTDEQVEALSKVWAVELEMFGWGFGSSRCDVPILDFPALCKLHQEKIDDLFTS